MASITLRVTPAPGVTISDHVQNLIGEDDATFEAAATPLTSGDHRVTLRGKVKTLETLLMRYAEQRAVDTPEETAQAAADGMARRLIARINFDALYLSSDARAALNRQMTELKETETRIAALQEELLSARNTARALRISLEAIHADERERP